MALTGFPIAIPISAIDKLSGPLAKMGGNLGRFGAKARRAGTALSLGISAPVLGLGALTLATAANFEQSMNRVAALTDSKGTPALAALTDQAKELGSTTQFSASQAADAMGFLAQAGFDTTKILATMPSALDLAAAGQLELAETADIASNVLTGFRLEASEMTRVANVLTGTFARSNTDLVQLGEAFKLAGPVAAGMGQSFEETAAILGAMGNAGFQATMAGTALRGALAKLGKPTSEASRALAKLKIPRDALVDAKGDVRGMIDIVGLLEKSGASAIDMLTIFGQRAGPAMTALVGQGADAIRTLQTELSGITAAEIAAVQMEGAAGGVRALKSAFEGLQLAIADSGLLEWFTGMVGKLTAFTQRLSAANPKTLRLGVIVAGVAAALGPLLIAVGLVSTGIGAIGGGITLVLPILKALSVMIFRTAIPAVLSFTAALLTNPFTWVVIGIAAVIGAGFLLVKHWRTIVGWFVKAWGWIRDAVMAAVRLVARGIQWLVDLVPDWLIDLIKLVNPAGGFALGLVENLASSDPSRDEIDRVNDGTGRARDANVRVEFDNLPEGARVTSDAGPDSPLDLDVGPAMVVPG